MLTHIRKKAYIIMYNVYVSPNKVLAQQHMWYLFR